MIAVIHAVQFRLQSAIRWHPEHGAAIVVDGDAQRGVVLECSGDAVELGVRVGMPVARALARCPDLRVVVRCAEAEMAFSALLVELACHFSPRVECSSMDSVTLDLSAVSRTVCWQTLGAGMVSACAKAGLDVRVGIARAIDHATLAAHHGSTAVTVIRDGRVFCAALPMTSLGLSPSLAKILQDWGIDTGGAFLNLPASDIVERLGPEAATLRARLLGRSKRPLKVVEPVERYAEAMDFDEPVDSVQSVLFLLNRFLDSLTIRLRAGYRVATRMRLELPTENGPLHAREFSIPAPTTSAEVLLRILDGHLESLTLPRRVTGVRLEIFAAPPTGAQLDLFERTLKDPNRFGETLARIKAIVGDNAVGVSRPANSHDPRVVVMEVPEFSAMSMTEPRASGTVAPRFGLPLRRRRPALTVAVRTKAGCPVGVTIPSGSTRKVIHAAGPYRLGGDWWDKQSWEFEEWDVELADGSVLRLAKFPEGWKLEGVYDCDKPEW